MHRIKHFLFEYHILLSAVVVTVVFYFYGTREELRNPEFLFGGVGIGGGISYFAFQQILAERQLLYALFKEFNARYENMNDILFEIEKGKDTLTDQEKKALVGYFNLCSEEWMYFRDGLIPSRIWNSWDEGMKHYHSIPRIKEFWDSELAKNSYYGFKF
jgi:hypothetical protein